MKSNQKSLTFFALALLVLLAVVLRVWKLEDLPAGPYYDEAANGILAADIAERGYRPIFVTSYTGKEALYFWAIAGVMKLLGVNLFALRFTSVLFGVLTVAATFWCVRELFAEPKEKHGVDLDQLALLTAGLLTSSFWHLGLSRMGLRGISEPFFQALTLGFLWRGLRRSDWRLLLIGGIFCGLSAYTYLSARFFPFPLALALFTLLVADRKQWKRRLSQGVIFVVAAVVAFAPLGVYFIRNPERFLVRFEQVVVETEDEAGTAMTLPQSYSKALGMFFVQGSFLPRFNIPGKSVFGPWLGAAFVLGLVLAAVFLFRDRQPLERARGVLLLCWIPIMILPTALTLADIVPNHLRAVGLMPLVFVFPALALAWLVAQLLRWRSGWANWLPWLVLAAVMIYTVTDTVEAYFVEQPQRMDHYIISDGDMADMADWLNATELGDAAVYIGSLNYRHPTLAFLCPAYDSYKWLTGSNTVVTPASGRALILNPRSMDYSWAQPYLPPLADFDLPKAPDGSLAFEAYWMEADTPLEVGHEMQVDFSHVIQLNGYDVLGEPGLEADLEVVLSWQVLNPAPSGDFQVFAHLMDSWGTQWAETLPFQYPSAMWVPGERFLDRLRLRLPPGTPPGEYWLEVGLYSPEADRNLTAVSPDGRFAGTVAQIPAVLGPAAEPQRPTAIRQALNTESAPGLTLLGANLDTRSARTREPVFLSLFWQARISLDDLTVRLWLGDQLLYEGAPVHGTYPTAAWRPGVYVVDRYNPRVPLEMPAGEWSLVVEVETPDGQARTAELGAVTVQSPTRSYDVPAMEHAFNQRLGESVELLGFDVADLDTPTVGLTLYWRAVEPMETDYTVYVHWLDAAGVVLGQVDAMPQGGGYPTSIWAAGEVVVDSYQINRPSESSGPFAFRVGMYKLSTGEQLGEPLLIGPLEP